MPLISHGHVDFGENKVQDALTKMEQFPSADYPDLHWHLIGPLQSNKAKKTVGHFSLLHAIDSISTAEAVSRHNAEAGLRQAILLQVNMSADPSRHGFSPEALRPTLDSLMSLEGITIQGLMTMAPPQASLDQDLQQLSNVFCGLQTIRDELVAEYGIAMPDLSMGMSHDFPQALECGATIIRLGNYLFKT